jgi:uncharacterized iron-regulated membrane protein
MAKVQQRLRRALRAFHLWLGLAAGLFFLLMGASGGVVALRPQIAAFLAPSPAAAGPCASPIDWNRAERDVQAFAGSRIDRIYFPGDTDPRVHFRMMGDRDKIYGHVIYDTCAAKVVGTANLAWMDWIVDFHHNLRADRTGRTWGGAIAIAMLVSGVAGFLLWVLAGAKLSRLFRVHTGTAHAKTSLDLHRMFGLIVGSLLMLASFTALWLCFPQAMRGMLARIEPEEPVPVIREPHAAQSSAHVPATLNDLIAAAERAIPGGAIREIRMPDGDGPVRIRMWRTGDFRSLGNNVVTLDRGSARVLSVDLYAIRPDGNRFVQAMAGLHYGEWGGLWFRCIYAAAGLLTPALFITGFLAWWLSRRRKLPARSRSPQPVGAGAHLQDTNSLKGSS